MKIANAKQAQMWSWSPSMLFGRTPKMSVQCGSCSTVFSARADVQDRPIVQCTGCGVGNRINVIVR